LCIVFNIQPPDIEAQFLAQKEVDLRLTRVKSMATACARLEQNGMISALAIPAIFDSMLRITADTISRYDNVIDVDAQLIVSEIQGKLENQLELTSSSGGTLLTPDQDAKDMDSSIPFYEPNDNGNGKVA